VTQLRSRCSGSNSGGRPLLALALAPASPARTGQSECIPLPAKMVNGKGRSHQQTQPLFLSGIEFRADTAHARRASEIADFLEVVMAR
jgi:hypothetical protein